MTRQRGFTMVEILIAMLILAIGLLGVAGVQVLALKETTDANIQSQVNFYAQNIVEQMRADLKGVKAGDYNTITSSGCSSCSTAFEKSVVNSWLQEVNTNIPGGKGAVSVASGVATVTITWSQRGSAASDQSSVNTKTYTLIARIINV